MVMVAGESDTSWLWKDLVVALVRDYCLGSNSSSSSSSSGFLYVDHPLHPKEF